MPTPQLLNDIISLLLLLAPSAALVSLLLAGIALRHDGATAFVIGGGFTLPRLGISLAVSSFLLVVPNALD